MWWQLLPLLRQAGKVPFHILPLALDTQFVRFGEDDGEGDAVLAQPFNKCGLFPPIENRTFFLNMQKVQKREALR